MTKQNEQFLRFSNIRSIIDHVVQEARVDIIIIDSKAIDDDVLREQVAPNHDGVYYLDDFDKYYMLPEHVFTVFKSQLGENVKISSIANPVSMIVVMREEYANKVVTQLFEGLSKILDGSSTVH